MLLSKDVEAIRSLGMDVAAVEKQLERFKEGYPFLDIVRPASVGDGIERLDAGMLEAAAQRYDASRPSLCVVKFVPASGAATRMFKDLYAFLSSGTSNKVSDEVLANLHGFAFCDKLAAALPASASSREIIGNIVGGCLGYGAKPKALILFHRYEHEVRTALEEHLVEGALYCACAGRVSLHFTVSPEHIEEMRSLLDSVLPVYGKRFGVDYDVTMSVQKRTTDTIAVNPDNTPFREADGSLLFRPSGHGALIENLGDIDADIIFIKNIDNVTTDSRRADTVAYKRALAGRLLDARDKAYGFVRMLEAGSVDDDTIGHIADFVRGTFHVGLPDGFDNMEASQQAVVLHKLLDRPIRVCGMVPNEGEPGGGPFFVRRPDGLVSLQIAESSQIDPAKRGVMAGATHFNPVDIVCSTRDCRGRRYDLRSYVDEATGFISEKSKDGRPLKALERPGLWNGAMADWNTIFVEVPITTFTPVKVVTDLLRAGHQER